MMKRSKKGFTLVEMLVVMGLIAILLAMMTGGMTYVQTTARQAQAQELVSNVATALTIYLQREGTWPTEIVTSQGVVNNAVCKVLQQARLLDVTTVKSDGTINKDSPERFGLLSPWGQRMVRSRPKLAATLGALPSDAMLRRHMLQFRVDLNYDGKIDSSDGQLGAIPVKGGVIRSSAIVWACGPNGKDDGSTGAKNERENRQSWVGGGK